MPIRGNVWPFGPFGLTMQSASPFGKRLVRRLRFAFVSVNSATRFAAEHSTVPQPKQYSRHMITAPERFLQRRGDIDSNIDADFIDQTQRPHRHTPFKQCIVDLLCVEAGFEKLSGIEQIWKQDAIDEKSGTVPHDNGKLPNLPNERERVFLRVVRRFPGNNHFDKFHSANWIEKM